MMNYKPTRPTLAFYHANCRGTGSAAKFELHPAHGDIEGHFLLVMARQADLDPKAPMPRFDWERAISAKLCFGDICALLQVLRGETESIEDGKGLFHATPSGTARIVLRHIVEPVEAYSLEVHKCVCASESVSERILFTRAESLGLMLALESAIGLVAFGCQAPTVA